MRQIACSLAAMLLALNAAPSAAFAESTPTTGVELEKVLATLDGAVFDAFNRCADPAQLHEHASYFAPDVEFYHDHGGATWTRDAMLANTAKRLRQDHPAVGFRQLQGLSSP